jgi:hypothetical protein
VWLAGPPAASSPEAKENPFANPAPTHAAYP